MKFIKLFENHSDYEEFAGGGGACPGQMGATALGGMGYIIIHPQGLVNP